METFETFELAEQSLKDELIWSKKGLKKYEKKSKSYKQFYRCNLVRSRCKVQCSSGCVIILPADKTNAEVHRTTFVHDHKEKVMGVTLETRKAIDQMLKVVNIIRPKTILSHLEALNTEISKDNAKLKDDPTSRLQKEKSLLAIPLDRDLYNFLSQYRKKTLINGTTDYHLGDLHALCAVGHEELENETDTVFTIRFQIFCADEEYGKEDDFEATNKGDQLDEEKVTQGPARASTINTELVTTLIINHPNEQNDNEDSETPVIDIRNKIRIVILICQYLTLKI